MYQIKKGKLYKDGKETFCLGQSYYPSFHPSKFPVPPEGDRQGEMKKDLRMMAELGFNHVRFAALGEVALEGEHLKVETPFIDAMTEEAEKNNISVSVRQQGFAVNLRGFPDVEMQDWDGKVHEYRWSDFIRTSLWHEGILEDNRIYAKGLAEHFSKFPNMVAYQIYNEPHYPAAETVFDYHPETVRAYRRLLVEKGLMSEKEAEGYQPPRSRKEQNARMWAIWRLFARDSITSFLDNAAKGSKAGAPLPTYTCYTADPLSNGNVTRGCDYFGNARSMDLFGYTTYVHAYGANAPILSMQADLAQCAAELAGTQSWCIELDSRTYIPSSIYNRGTYMVLGSGCKGIIYYQWRGDCPVPGVPHPNSCGLLNYDGTKTANFDNAAKVNQFILAHNDLLMAARRAHEGVGLLHSDYAAFFCDGLDNPDRLADKKQYHNQYFNHYLETYKELKQTGISVSIVDCQGLSENPFGIKVLLLPSYTYLSSEEQATVEAFRKKGGAVYELVPTNQGTSGFGYLKMDDIERSYEQKVFLPRHTPRDVLDAEGIIPKVVSLEARVSTQLLEGEDFSLVVLTNTSVAKVELSVTVETRIPFKTASFFSIDGEKPLKIEGHRITVEALTDGGFLILR